tara:strand:- start:1131 stop:1727 length:597 start_codon:yes stop_codon:yes gene_type:complete
MTTKTANLDRIRARVLWLLAKLRSGSGPLDAHLSTREVLSSLEVESLSDLPGVLGFLPSGTSFEFDSDGLRIFAEQSRVDLEGSVLEVAAYWKQVTKRDARTELSTKRLSLIRARLRSGRTVDELRRAVDACAASPWHSGENPNGLRYNDCEHIFSPERLDRWLSSSPSTSTRLDAPHIEDSATRETLLRRKSGRLGR